MKHIHYKKLFGLITVCALVISSICIYSNHKSRSFQKINVDGDGFMVKLVEFAPPVKVGMDAPELPKDKLFYLRSFSIAKNPRDHSYEEAISIASESTKRYINKENYNKIREQINEENRTFFQATVDYAVEIKIVKSGRSYLILGYRAGYLSENADPNSARVLSIYIYESGRWKSCAEDPGFDLIHKRFKLTSLSALRNILHVDDK